MEEVVKFLKDANTYYLATVEGDQPRVRPFGTAHIFEGKLYIQTGKVKKFPNSSMQIRKQRSVPSRAVSGSGLQESLLRMTEERPDSPCWMIIRG